MPADPGRALAHSASALREEGTFTFEASFTRVLATTPDEVEEYATATGALDLSAGAGRAELDLTQLLPGGLETPLSRPVQLRWAGTSLTIAVEGRTQTLRRVRARSDAGLIGRYPDEVESLDDLLAHPSRARLLERKDGTAHYAFAYGAGAAGRLGVPAELSDAFKQALYGPRLELEAWIEDDGLPHRISYAVQLKPARSAGKLVLPARTIRVTYELDGFGEEFVPGG